MKHKLKLGTLGSEVLDVTTFGTLQGRRKTYDLEALTLSTEVENIKITALVTPVICPPLSAKVKNLQIPPELQGLKLADPSHSLKIQITQKGLLCSYRKGLLTDRTELPRQRRNEIPVAYRYKSTS